MPVSGRLITVAPLLIVVLTQLARCLEVGVVVSEHRGERERRLLESALITEGGRKLVAVRVQG